MIQSITFNDKNTWTDWGLLPTERPVFSSPKQKTTYIDIPGGDGALDLSESLAGYPTYENRTGSFEFRILIDPIDVPGIEDTNCNLKKPWPERYSEMLEYLHGKSMNAILADDSDYFYTGRFSIDNFKQNKEWATVTIGYNVNPYKWSVLTSVDDWIWDSFNFEYGIIRDVFKDIEVDLDIGGNDYEHIIFNGDLFGTAPITRPILRVSKINEEDEYEVPAIIVKLRNNTLGIDTEDVYLDEGDHDIRDFIFYGDSEYDIQVKGHGLLSFIFRIGRL